MSKKLFVGNLNFKATEKELRDVFSPYGEVQLVTLVSDKYTGRSRGFAFVEMTSDESAEKAREALNGKPFQDRNITVDWARPEGERPSGPRREGPRESSGRRPFRR